MGKECNDAKVKPVNWLNII